MIPELSNLNVILRPDNPYSSSILEESTINKNLGGLVLGPLQDYIIRPKNGETFLIGTLGVDEKSLFFILLTTFVTPICILSN